MKLYPRVLQILATLDLPEARLGPNEWRDEFDLAYPSPQFIVATKPDGKKHYVVREGFDQEVGEWGDRLRSWVEDHPNAALFVYPSGVDAAVVDP